MNAFKIALGQYGIREVSGDRDNPEVLKYFNEIGFDGSKLKDETAWCSAFVNWCCLTAGKPCTGKLNARSWLDIGEEITTPRTGDIVVFWREEPNSWKGHVGFFVAQRDGWVWTLGGNQSNRVQISAYPSGRVIGYRRL